MKWNPRNLEQFHSVIGELFTVITVRKSNAAATVICVHGDLGAGKTTMTQAIGKILGIKETIMSPTFVIKKSYTTPSAVFKTLIHMDAYRLEGEQNLDALRLDEDFKIPDALMIIEWPELIQDTIPTDAIHVFISHAGEGRMIEIK
jgi:tRNA threonylcarbamoyladenosine biosynthesis protein TsaE